MLTVRQSNALVALNQAIEAAKACGVFDNVKHTAEVLENFSTEMLNAEKDDHYRDYCKATDSLAE